MSVAPGAGTGAGSCSGHAGSVVGGAVEVGASLVVVVAVVVDSATSLLSSSPPQPVKTATRSAVTSTLAADRGPTRAVSRTTRPERLTGPPFLPIGGHERDRSLRRPTSWGLTHVQRRS